MKNKRIAITLSEEQLTLLNCLSTITNQSKTKIVSKAIEIYCGSIVASLSSKEMNEEDK